MLRGLKGSSRKVNRVSSLPKLFLTSNGVPSLPKLFLTSLSLSLDGNNCGHLFIFFFYYPLIPILF